MGVWTPALLLPSGNAATLRAICAQGKTVHYARIEFGNLQYMRSLDEGASWSADNQLATSHDDVPLTHAMEADGDVVHLTSGQSTDNASAPPILNYWRSADRGATWAGPSVIDNGVGHGNNRFYRQCIRSLNGVVHHVWVCHSATTFTTDGLFYRKSSDNGATWGSVVQLYSGTTNSPGRPSVVLDGDAVHVTYTDARYGTAGNGSGEVIYGRSRDGGTTWDTEQRITNTSTGFSQAFGALRPDIWVANGRLLLAWQNTSDGTDDIYITQSADGGATWASNQRFTFDSTFAEEHTMICGQGTRFFMTYGTHTDNASPSIGQVYVVRSDDAGLTWGTPFRVTPTSTDQGAPLICMSNRFVHLLWAPGGGGAQYQRQFVSEFPG